MCQCPPFEFWPCIGWVCVCRVGVGGRQEWDVEIVGGPWGCILAC